MRSETDRPQRERLLTLLEMPVDDSVVLRREAVWRFTAKDLAHLAWGVSTDEILPSHAAGLASPQELGHFALTGLAGVAADRVAASHVDVLIAGGRFGVGSSREQAVLALMGAGIRYILVVGGPAERIFKENCLVCGGPILLELPAEIEVLRGVLAAIRSHAPISERWSDGVRPLIRESGGLMGYVQRQKSGVMQPPPIAAGSGALEHVPRSGVERLIARRLPSPLRRGDVGFVPVDLRYSYDVMSRLLESSLERGAGERWIEELADPRSIMLFEDHLCHVDGDHWQATLEHQRDFAKRAGVRLRANTLSAGCNGVCHSVIVEEAMVTPGQICVGTDSQTCTLGVLGALAFGVGTTTMAAAFLSGEVLLEVPPTVRVEFDGDLKRGVSAKDAMLHLLALPDVAMGCCVGRMLEFAGPALARWSLDQQLVLTNMAVEAGAFSGIIGAPTPAVCRHLQQTHGMTTSDVVAAWPVSAGKSSCDLVIRLDLSRVRPMVALPPKPANATPVEKLAGKAITSGFIGSCTGGNLSDLRAAADVLEGLELAVPLVVQPATMWIMETAAHEGLLKTFRDAGAQVLTPGCGACCGLGPGGVQREGDVVVAATARNYPGRMSWPDAKTTGEVLLASPATVAASCLRGRLAAPNGKA